MSERSRTTVPVMPKTRRADPLLSLVAEAKDGHWHDLIEHLAGNAPITTRGRIAVAGLMHDLLEPYHLGRPRGPATDAKFMEQVAVLFMQRAAARFKKEQGRDKLRRDELVLLAKKATSKVNELMFRPASKKRPALAKLKVAKLIGSTNEQGVGSSRGYPYAKPASAEVCKWVRKNWHMLEAPIEHELVAALVAPSEKSKH